MHVHFLDPYRPRTSPIHALDARIKFVLTVAFILTVSLTPVAAWSVYILLFALILSVEILSGLGIGYVLKRALLALPFVLAALPVIFTLKGTALFTISLGSWTLTASLEGLERFVSVVLKSWLSVQAAIVMASSTPFPELLQAMRAVGIPRLLVGMFGLMWRYLFVLVDEALRLMRARAARSGQSAGAGKRLALSGAEGSGGSVAWRARVAGGMAGNLFLRAFERSDRIYVAMLSRGYDGEVRTLPLVPLTSRGWLTLAAGLFLLLLLLLFGILFWG
ncbi:cobalt ECF transporter T component CbiQ [bacterium]|nr:cobalt ECF transporter T component CbiQ [bacterium]PIU91138.1 MAG: cobalt ECF transporter T component CbiQ [Anaerolineae bacterium CG06_land_8_20_14_3_00_57_67]PIW20821.1 MAG: cobalt ECF transporter T component CbiQ [Anaerolineae bacterium CG17_big_fil_post_rev_8_21_14_2_50_57_27]